MRRLVPLLCPSLLLLSAALLLPGKARADYRVLATSETQDKVLDEVLGRAGPGKVVLFDLDSTLIDTRPRQVAILRAWAAREDVTELQALSVDHFQSWDWKETLKRAGVPIAKIPELSKKVRSVWSQEFWRDDSLVHDLPLPGAARFVRSVHQKGATVVYVGRRTSQEKGTRATLKRCGFPLDERARLILDEVERAETKKARRSAAREAHEATLASVAAVGSVVAAFANDGTGVDELRERFQDAVVVHVHTDGVLYTRRPGPWVHGFLRSADVVPRPGAIPDVPDPKTPLKVLKVSDGDTVTGETPDGERFTLRLIGIDTPEHDPLYDQANMADKKRRHVEGYGQKLVDDRKAWEVARDFLQATLARGELHLRYDPANAENGHRDSTMSRRLLCYLWVKLPDGQWIDVNAELCKQGYTLDYAKRYPHLRGAEFSGYVQAAKQARVGYWSDRWQAP
ncbi:MAG: thermonuclease family protein [Planctomycetota bacterium]